MSKINDGGPAHPTLVFARDGKSKNFREQRWPGLSLRDHFAGQALNGMLAHATRYRPYEKDRGLHWHEAIAIEAYELADAMLAARTKGGDADE